MQAIHDALFRCDSLEVVAQKAIDAVRKSK
jgi:hypothetical protein